VHVNGGERLALIVGLLACGNRSASFVGDCTACTVPEGRTNSTSVRADACIAVTGERNNPGFVNDIITADPADRVQK
jgi:hypothetical protein